VERRVNPWALACVGLFVLVLLLAAGWAYTSAVRQAQVDGVSKNLDATRHQVEQLCQATGNPDCKPVAPPARTVQQQPTVQPSPIPGPTGGKGAAGTNGRDSVIPGPTGSPGKNGSSPPCLSTPSQCQGADGKDGAAGQDGKDGTNGQDGKDGSAGAQGPAGASCPDGMTFQPEVQLSGNTAMVCEAAAPSPTPSPTTSAAALTARPRSSPSPDAPAGGGGLQLPFGLGLVVGFWPPHWLRREL